MPCKTPRVTTVLVDAEYVRRRAVVGGGTFLALLQEAG